MSSSELVKSMPRLGFGMMRLPMEEGRLDVPLFKQLVDTYMSYGFNYFDTAYIYHNSQSECAVRDYMLKWYKREDFKLCTKVPPVKSREEFKTIFEAQLGRTNAQYFDNYLFHYLKADISERYDEVGCWDFMLEMKDRGFINHVGFSTHDTPENLDKILQKHSDDVEFVQVQINWNDWEDPVVQSRRMHEVCRKYNKPMTIMEPNKGGSLTTPPQEVVDMLKAYNPDAPIGTWAMRFAASQEGVMTVLSGMRSVEIVKENCETLLDGNFKPITEEEKAVLAKCAEYLHSRPGVPCTACRYCIDECPKKIPITDYMKLMDQYLQYGNHYRNKAHYDYLTYPPVSKPRASECIKCGKCEAHCPQHLEIRNYLSEVVETFEKAKRVF